ALAQLTRDLLLTQSIFKGKAFTIPVDDDGDLEVMEPPVFMDVRNTDPSQLLLNQDVVDQVRTSLWGPIQNTEACRTNRIPLKRGVLLEGPYGCGKSLTASITAKLAQDNGWTFINLDKVQGLKAALEFANRYQPAVIFAEDIDRLVEERDEDANDLINTIDGVLSKHAEVMVVLTTNHIEKIQQVMLRPGRLDAVISIPAPDSPTVQALVRMYGRNTIAKNTDLSEIGDMLAGQIPATVREVVERSKLAMIVRGETEVTAAALKLSAVGMTAHLDLLNRKKDAPTEAEKLHSALKSLVSGGGSDPEKLADKLSNQMAQGTQRIRREVSNANDPCMRLYSRLGFEPVDEALEYIEMTWRAA
ncbi:MAG: ATP-binding protein, partial [Alphaproteobacteria bacterium]